MEKLDDETNKLLKSIIDKFSSEDRGTRERQIHRYQRLKLYWNNLSRIYWSEVAHDYKLANSAETNDDQAYYDRPVNVFKPFLETIIAALSIQIPAVICVPDDVDNPDDLSTAKAGDIIGEQIYKQNDVVFLWLQALYVHCTEGLIAMHHYPKESEEYGTYEESIFKDTQVDAYACPNCGAEIPDEIIKPSIPEGDVLELEIPPACPSCKAELSTDMDKVKIIVPKFSGTEKRNKARICLEVYGGLYVRVANYAKKQSDTPFLSFEYETHYVNALERYPRLRDKMPKNGSVYSGLTGSYDPFEQNARANPQYAGNIPENTVTIRNWWLRPSAFNVLNKEDCDRLKKKFPDGAKVVLVNELCADYDNEDLDSRWTISRNPLSDYLTHEPLGELLTNIQDIVNDLISLALQNIEHAVVQIWADPAVVNFEGQAQLEANPGLITPTKPQGTNKNISDAFFSTQAAALSPEVFNFYRIVQELGQFVSGALPSLFGGNPGNTSSKTASEYAMSKGMAMQRLQTPWKMMTIWWKTVFGKVIPQYMAEIVQDEKFVNRTEQGNFVNVFIRKSEINGRIGQVELDASDHVPISDEQKSEIIMQFMQLNNPAIMQAFASPENLPFIRKVIKIPEFRLPGEDDRQKQYEEINQLLAGEPIPSPTEEAEITIELPSVDIDELIDDHMVEAEICRGWLISAAGRLAKLENPTGYKNVLLHMKSHMDIIRQNVMAQQQLAAAATETTPDQESKTGNKPPKKSNEKNPKIEGEKDAQLPIQ